MSAHDLGVRVACYAGHRGEETPQRFFMGQREVVVTDVLDRWLDPSRRYFKIRGDDGGVYILCHDIPSGRWELTLFDVGSRGDTRLSST